MWTAVRCNGGSARERRREDPSRSVSFILLSLYVLAQERMDLLQTVISLFLLISSLFGLTRIYLQLYFALLLTLQIVCFTRGLRSIIKMTKHKSGKKDSKVRKKSKICVCLRGGLLQD